VSETGSCTSTFALAVGCDVYLSPGDAGRFFACTVEAPAELRWAVLDATSKPTHRLTYDLEPTRKLVGFEPRETWPAGAEDMLKDP
jgi:hypothetical protein